MSAANDPGERPAGVKRRASETVAEPEGRSPRLKKDGGEGGIRTPVPVTRQDAFEAPPLRPLRYLSVFGALRCSLHCASCLFVGVVRVRAAELLILLRLRAACLPAAFEEPLDHFAAFGLEDAALDLEFVVQRGMVVGPHG